MTDPCLCPTCSRPYDGIPLGRLQGLVTPTMRRILDAVARKPGIPALELAARVYEDDPEGGPETAERSISTIICTNNRRLRPHGWIVRSEAGPGNSGYRLLPVEGAPA